MSNKIKSKITSKISAPKEIERKFLIKILPEDLNKFPHKDITQNYLSIKPNNYEIRTRKIGNEYFKTTKSGAGKTRKELDIEITKNEFEELQKQTIYKEIKKTRYKIPHDNYLIELDIYHGELAGLITAEVEFNSEEESNQFKPPEWLGKEITEDAKYKNQSLALHGLPK